MLKKANTNFNKLGHKFEILLNEKTEIEELNTEENSIKKFEFNFVRLKNISSISKNTIIGNT